MYCTIPRLLNHIAQSPDWLHNLEIGTQFWDSENAQCDLEIVQIPRLRGTYIYTSLHMCPALWTMVIATRATPNLMVDFWLHLHQREGTQVLPVPPCQLRSKYWSIAALCYG